MSRNMVSYPNRDALREAHDIYLNAMKSFIVECLKESGGAAEEIVTGIEDTMEVADIPHLVQKYWEESFKQYFMHIDRYYEIRGVTWVIKEGRNRASHPPWDLDPEFTQTHLFLIANLLEKIDRPDAKRRIENIQDRLFSDNTARQTEDVEQAAYRKRLANMSTQLAKAVAGKTTVEERLSGISNQLEEAEVENAELKKRLSEKENRLKTVESEKAELEERLKNSPKRPETAKNKFGESNDLDERKEIGRKVAELRINSTGSKSMSWARIRAKLGLKNDEFHKVIRLEDHFRESVVERIESFEGGWEYGGKLEVLLGFDPVGELLDRIEACKPTPKVEEPAETEYPKSEESQADKDSVVSSEVSAEIPSYRENTAKSLKFQRKWRRPGAVAALRDPAEIRQAEAKIAKILNQREKTRLERELREAKQAVYGSVT